MSMVSKFELQRFSRFLVMGAIAASTNLPGLITAFVLMRVFVFAPSDRSVLLQFSRFVMVNIVSFVQVWLVSVGLVRIVFPVAGFAWHAEMVGHVIGMISPALSSYLLHRQVSFSPSRE
jgi:putative flippase GtrA